MSDTDKQKALQLIEEKLQTMKQALREAQEIADKHSLTFFASLDLPPGNRTKAPFSDYAPVAVSGTYYGAGSDTEFGDEEENKQGYWYWQNSSLRC